MAVEELELMLEDDQNELFELRNQAKQEKTEKPHLIRHKRKDIARLKTIVGEKTRNQ